MMRDMISMLPNSRSFPFEGKEVLVYGGGGYGRRTRDLLNEIGAIVIGVMDANPKNCDWISAMRIEEAYSAYPEAIVVLGLFSPGPDLASIARKLTGLGWSRVVTPPEFFQELSRLGLREQRYWLTTELDYYEKQASDILRARASMADNASRVVFDELLSYRHGEGAYSYPQPRPIEEQHTGVDFGFSPLTLGTVVDCGAYIGDTLLNWETVKLRHRQILALEPDPTTFRSLVEASSLSALAVMPLPIGVSETSGMHSIVGQGVSATLEPDTRGNIYASSLNDLLLGVKTSFIKMDIEGAEAGALRGGLEILRRDRPWLSISVYHKPWHLWSIQNWLSEFVGGYQFHMRVYGHQGYDTILYATPVNGN